MGSVWPGRHSWHGGGERWRGECACGGGSVPRLVSEEEHAVDALLSRLQAWALVRSLACSLLPQLRCPLFLSLSRLHWEIFIISFLVSECWRAHVYKDIFPGCYVKRGTSIRWRINPLAPKSLRILEDSAKIGPLFLVSLLISFVFYLFFIIVFWFFVIDVVANEAKNTKPISQK